MKNEQLAKFWSSENAVRYYLTHRDNTDELYKSEKYFIQDAFKDTKNMLDIGCAAGGFSKIVRQYNKDINYVGVDISPAMISEAKKRYNKSNFYLCDGERLDFPEGFFDLCICLGVLHMTESWRKLLAEAWRVCRGTLIFDLRIVEGEGVCDAALSYQRLEFDMEWDGISKAPYVVVNLDEAMNYIIGMEPEMRSLSSYGYVAPVSKMTVSRYRDVCMSMFCLKKKGNKKIFDWKLPLKVSDQLKHKYMGD